MKKIILFLLLSNSLYSQGNKGLYAYAQLGYKLGSVYTTFPNEYNLAGNEISLSYIRFGGGNNITGAVGYMIHPNLGFEVSTTYTIGHLKKSSITNSTGGNALFISKEAKSMTMHSTGSIVAQVKLKDIFFYAKAGIVITYYSQSNINNTYTNNNQTEDFEYRYYGSIMRGFNGSLGVLIPISKKMRLMIEAEEVSVQGHFTNASLLSNNTLGSLPNRIEYYDNIIGKNSTTSLQYERSYPISYSCIGLNIGIHHTF